MYFNKLNVKNFLFKPKFSHIAGSFVTSLFTYHTICGYITYSKKFHDDLISRKMVIAISNGCIAIFPYLLVSTFTDISRMEIWLRGLDKDKHSDIYKEYINV